MACPDGSVTWFYEQAFAAGDPLDLTNYPERESFSNMSVSTGDGPAGENTATPTSDYGLVGLNGDGAKDTAPEAGRRNGMVQFDLDYSAYTGSEEANILDVRGAHKDVPLFWIYALSAADYNDWYDYLEDPMPDGHLVLELTTDLSNYVFFDAGVMDGNFHTFKVGWCSSTIDDDFNVAADGSIKVWVDDVEVYSATGLTLFGDTSSATPAECGLWNMAEFQTIGKLTNIKFGEFDAGSAFYDCGAPDTTPDDLCNKANVVAWVEWDVTDATTTRYSASMLDDPSTYYGGPKTPRVLKWGTVTRALSDFDGQWESARFSVELADTDRAIRGYVSANPVRGTALRAYLVSEEGRATAETPRVLFAGPLTKWTPTGDLRCELHGADRLANVLGGMLGRPERTVPSRLINGTDFPTAPATSVGKPVPIIYGAYGDNNETPSAGAGICPVIYTGTRTLSDSQTWHEWVVAGHACKELAHIYVNNVYQTTELGTTWLIPDGANWSTASATPYRDFNGRRYTVIYGRGSVPDEVAAGTKVVFCNVQGCEETGDGTGTLIQDLFKIYVHWLINWALQEYQSGDWLDMPTGPVYDTGWCVVNVQSFLDASTTALARVVGGYPGVVYIGPDAKSVRDWIADFNVSCDARLGLNEYSQWALSLLPDITTTASLETFSDVVDIHADSLQFDINTDGLVTRVNAVASRLARGYVPNGEATWIGDSKWGGGETYIDTAAETQYGQIAARLELPFLSNVDPVTLGVAAEDVAQRWLARRSLPLTRATWRTGLCGLRADLGDIVKLTHFAGVDSAGWVDRLVEVERLVVDVNEGTVAISGRDVTDLVGLGSASASPSVSPSASLSPSGSPSPSASPSDTPSSSVSPSSSASPSSSPSASASASPSLSPSASESPSSSESASPSPSPSVSPSSSVSPSASPSLSPSASDSPSSSESPSFSPSGSLSPSGSPSASEP